ncbi:DEKNAAC104478 [Brettanomyces naardenensis]|uniref:DEKNAAC104478 n=1 Tax=Brettanomyces naardenensis TaxID=13370 RepID=A0A448YR98_BRENA|nr:DEKNAAC104478 [Brettanomyces naardenensis]
MSTLPITSETIGTIFGSPYRKDAEHDDPSSDYGVAIDWLCEQIVPDSFQISEVPLRVKNSLRNIGRCNEWLFGKFSDMVRQKLNCIGKEIDSLLKDLSESGQTGQLGLLFSRIINLSGILQQCYLIVGLDTAQEHLMERLENSIFQSWVTEKSVWEAIQVVYEDKLFDEDGSTLEALLEMSDLLDKIDLGNEMTQLLLETARTRIKHYVGESCAGQWNRPRLAKLLVWVKDELFPRLTKLIPSDEFTVDCLTSMTKIELAVLRTHEIFDIVIDYPDSKCALEEFRECLITAEQRSKLVELFIAESKLRLLHAGTDTVDIIVCYISAIRSFLIVDHRGVLLDKACRPIRNHLRSRKDTVQQIVNALLNSTPANRLIELAIELRNTDHHAKVHEESERDLNWVPDPVEALPDFRKGVVEDIVESLISIFESKGLFVEEFVKVFSERLLQVTDYDVREIYSDLHLLKARFGNQEFNSLDVMLKDMLLSKEFDRRLRTKVPENVHSSVVSHLYWPKLPSYSFKMPQEIQAGLDGYQSAYEELKKGRKLLLSPSLCRVDINVNLGGKDHRYKVAADKAAILYFFQDQPHDAEVKLAVVCMKLQMSLLLAREGLKFWVKAKVLEECGLNTYRVNE